MSSNLSAEKCFVCNKPDNLTKSPLHCGKSFYHQMCINEYCEKKKAIICPECKKNITNKFVKDETFIWNPACGFKCDESLKGFLCFSLVIILFLSNIFFSFYTYSILPEPSYYVLGRLIAMFFLGI